MTCPRPGRGAMSSPMCSPIRGLSIGARPPTSALRSSAFGASTWQLYWKVILPAIVPTVLAGMRLGIVFCLLGVLIVEMFAGVRGMGYLMQRQAVAFKAAELFAATAMVSALSIAVVLFLDHLNQRLGRWR